MSTTQPYNVTWDSPSQSADGSMPLGNGDIALNSWVEPNGDLLFYIGKTDSWEDNGRLVKVGRMRFSFAPAPDLTHFRQTLDVSDATLRLQYGTDHQALHLQLWVDANQPLIHLNVTTTSPMAVTGSIELWRNEPTLLPRLEVSDIMVDGSQPNGQHAPTVVEPDTVLHGLANQIGWYHHNVKSVGPALMAELQGVTEFERLDPLLHRTFGALVQAENALRLNDHQLQSPIATHHHFEIAVLTQHPATPEQWLTAIKSTLASTSQRPLAERQAAHAAWWQAFWARSWIHLSAANTPQPEPELAAETQLVSQSYALQRYLQACAGRGAFPIKFNGSLFTVPYGNEPGDGDYRRWGSGYWWQNTRLPYFSMCAAGDYDLMQPLFQLYAGDLSPLWQYRTRKYFGYDGIFFSECVYFWGDVFSETYGWTPFAERSDPLQESGYHKWEWVGGLELIFLMLDYVAHTQDTPFLQTTLLPYADQVLRFFDHFYQTDATGKLIMHPAQALETWWECTNPMSEVAGLQAVTARLLALPEAVTTPAQRLYWRALQQKIPALPTHEVDGTPMLAAASAFDSLHNIENPELYAVFPFRLIAFEKPGVELGLAALEHRQHRGHFGWRQDELFMAYLGLAEEARAGLVSRAKNQNYDALSAFDPARAAQNRSRFPAFWGPNYDWLPDQCHGGVLVTTLQSMLMQCDGEKIHLFPAWPRHWNVAFKLHAPLNTIIEGSLKDGNVAFTVSPAARQTDVICRI